MFVTNKQTWWLQTNVLTLYRANASEVGKLAIDGWAVTFGTARRGLGDSTRRRVELS